MKRRITEYYHHIGWQHLHRYLLGFDLRYNGHQIIKGEHTLGVIEETEGERLKHRDALNKTA